MLGDPLARSTYLPGADDATGSGLMPSTPSYRGRPWWAGSLEPVPVRVRQSADPERWKRMDPERERRARQSMADADDSDASPAPRNLPAWNESVKAILAVERQLNGGHQLSELGIDWR